MRSAARTFALAVLVALAGATASGRAQTTCAPRVVSAAYEARIGAVLGHGSDVLGAQLIKRTGGPTYAAAAGALPPLLYARTSGKRSLTRTGVYYVPSAEPGGAQGAGSPTLHVADGSEILYGSVDGPRLSVYAGNDLFGSCVRRSTPARLGAGYLPVIRTAYTDNSGAHYTQESFGARLPDGASAAFLRVSTDRGMTRIVTRGGALTSRHTLAVEWAPRESSRARVISDEAYASARRSAAAYWDARLAAGAAIDVPERVVLDAERATLIQNLMLTWRYSIGNAYEEFSFPESIDGAQVLAEYGFHDVAGAMLRTSLTRRPEPYPNWKMGEKLLGVATAYRLSHDRALLRAATPHLAGYVRVLAHQLAHSSGLLGRERFSSDIPDSVLGLHSQAVAWQGLHAIAQVWASTGQPAQAKAAGTAAAELRSGLLRALARSTRTVDGTTSLFVPMRLLGDEQPYALLPASRNGSYWNLVAPYALASGLLARDPAGERAALRYLQSHGSRLLGLVRAGAFSLYGTGTAASGIDQVYGLNATRFLADLDQPDQIVLSLYGQLAAGMTRGTFVAGEAASVTPIAHAYYRSMYLPPNSVANAAFLETLRATVVHELPEGQGLELAYATPRAWLAPGKRISVSGLPTSFGPLTYSLDAHRDRVDAAIAVPRLGGRTLRLRLRLPRGHRISSVELAGKKLRSFSARTATIDLTGRRGPLQIEVHLAR